MKELVESIINDRFGEKIPFDEKAFSQISMFKSDNLKAILENIPTIKSNL